MLVTQHARHTALYRIMRGQGVRGVCDRIAFQQLERVWECECGLRRADLTTSIRELVDSGALLQHPGPDGPVLEVGDRGCLPLQPRLLLLRDFRWTAPLASLALALQSAVTLFRARLRTRHLLRRSTTLVIDRRSRDEG